MALMTEALEKDKIIDYAARDAILNDMKRRLHRKLTNIDFNIQKGKEALDITEEENQ